MNLLMAIAAIAALCGPRVQPGSVADSAATIGQKAKDCQVQMLKCAKAKLSPIEEALATCIQEIK